MYSSFKSRGPPKIYTDIERKLCSLTTDGRTRIKIKINHDIINAHDLGRDHLKTVGSIKKGSALKPINYSSIMNDYHLDKQDQGYKLNS